MEKVEGRSVDADGMNLNREAAEVAKGRGAGTMGFEVARQSGLLRHVPRTPQSTDGVQRDCRVTIVEFGLLMGRGRIASGGKRWAGSSLKRKMDGCISQIFRLKAFS